VIVAVGGATFYHFVYAPAHSMPVEVAYILPSSVRVVDTPAAVRLLVAELKNGDPVQVIARTRSWAHIRLADGKTGWIELKDLLDSSTYDRGQQLVQELQKTTPQAAGHAAGEIRLHLEPSRDASQLTIIHPNEKVQIFGRRLVARAPKDSAPETSADAHDDAEPGAAIRDAWYLVRAGSHAGWVLGRFIALEVPAEIGVYAEGVNTVGWLVLSTVDDNGRKVPQYLVADRIGTQEYDFNHIRAFTWWVKNQRYVTAYVESNVNGFFPIRVAQVDGRPGFRLRLVDKNGHKIQKVYAMFDTIVRPLGIVDGWESDASPTRPTTRSRHRK
jgi:hypothetical protein